MRAEPATNDQAASTAPPHATLLEINDLSLQFRTRRGIVRVLDGATLAIPRGQTVGIVGESGSGKSVLSFALLGILDEAGKVTRGTARFRPSGGGEMDLLRLSRSDSEHLRGSRISMIFQNPRTALNPIRTVGRQIEDVLLRHLPSRGRHARPLREMAVEMLARVRIPDPSRRYHAYPFELSGGMCQRVMIALALVCGPELLIADEPTTGLDATTQMAVMDLIQEMAIRSEMSTLLITHDLSLAARYCHRIVVMHAGQVVEDAPRAELFRRPRHPYTAGLMAATPQAGMQLRDLVTIPGGLPDLLAADIPPCRFSARCPRHLPACDRPLDRVEVEPRHFIACRNPL